MRQRVPAHPFWYHSIDLAPMVATPGWFDLRRSSSRCNGPMSRETLLLHQRDSRRALEAVRRVTCGHFLSSEQIEVGLTLRARHKPLYTLNCSGGVCQCKVPGVLHQAHLATPRV
jgi:hypothetical protein